MLADLSGNIQSTRHTGLIHLVEWTMTKRLLCSLAMVDARGGHMPLRHSHTRSVMCDASSRRRRRHRRTNSIKSRCGLCAATQRLHPSGAHPHPEKKNAPCNTSALRSTRAHPTTRATRPQARRATRAGMRHPAENSKKNSVEKASKENAKEWRSSALLQRRQRRGGACASACRR